MKTAQVGASAYDVSNGLASDLPVLPRFPRDRPAAAVGLPGRADTRKYLGGGPLGTRGGLGRRRRGRYGRRGAAPALSAADSQPEMFIHLRPDKSNNSLYMIDSGIGKTKGLLEPAAGPPLQGISTRHEPGPETSVLSLRLRGTEKSVEARTPSPQSTPMSYFDCMLPSSSSISGSLTTLSFRE